MIASLLSTAGCAQQAFEARRTALPQPDREIQTDVVGKLATLDNGIRLFVVPDPKAGLIEFDVRHHVGFRDDPPERAGLAHVVEHLMFEQTSASGVPIMLELPKHALHFNAYTSADETHYMQLGSADSLGVFVDHAAARLEFDCEALDDAVLQRELEVVRNELRLRGGEALGAVLQAIYPPSHPYQGLGGRGEEPIARITREDVCAFVERYYSPQTTDIIITGDVVPQLALQQIKERLGSIAGKEVLREPVPPVETKDQMVTVTAPVEEASALIAYALPPSGTAEAVDAAVFWNTASRLLPALLNRRKKQRAKSAVFGEMGGREAPVLLVFVQPLEGESMEKAAAEVRDVLADLVSLPMPPEAYERSRQLIRRSTLEDVASTLGSASAYADALSREPSRFYGDDLHVLDSLTPTRLQDVGQKYFDESRGTVLRVVPDPAREDAREEVRSLGQLDPQHVAGRSSIDAGEAHRPLPLPQSEVVEQTSFELDNGLEVVMLQTTDFPVMEATLVVHSGLQDAELPDVPMVVPLAFRPDPRLAETVKVGSAFHNTGSTLSADTRPTALVYRVRGLSIYLDFLLTWLSEYSINAVPNSDFAFAYRNVMLDLVDAGSVESLLRRDRVREAIWGPEHPNTLASATTRRELRGVTDGDIRRWQQRHVRADNATLLVTGGFDPELVRKYVDVYFGERTFRREDINRWNRPSEPRSRDPIPTPTPGSTRVFTAEVADARPLVVEMSFPVATTLGEDWAALQIVAEMLDVEVKRLRREFGVSYSFGAYVDEESPRIVVAGDVDGRRAAEAMPALLESIERLRRGDDFERRFAAARRVVLHRTVLERSDARRFADAAAYALQAGVGLDSVLERPREVATATPSQVRDVLDRVLPHERSVTLLEGSPAALEAALSAGEFGPSEALRTSSPD